jgi:hypothetical protein
MKKTAEMVIVLGVTLLAVFSCASAQTSAQTSAPLRVRKTFREDRAPANNKTERELIKAENEEVAAVSRKDTNALRRLLADEFTFVGTRASAERTHKDRYIENAFRYTWNSFNFSDFFIRVYDRTGVVNCKFTRDVALQGRDASGDFLFTDVWVKRSGRWQLVARHSTQLR